MNELCEKVRETLFSFFPLKVAVSSRTVLMSLSVAGRNNVLLFWQVSIEPQLFQFPTELAVLAFPCNQFGHQENATNQVLIDQTDYVIFSHFETLVNIDSAFA